MDWLSIAPAFARAKARPATSVQAWYFSGKQLELIRIHITDTALNSA